ncbi:hypothetical protein [Actinokineospora globicatena]|uniref:vWA-MoxR associated protein middle region 2 domain-containing protein n=1 Tax=Actinokineospora globicatena TaxID=103729 RepID=A0A9W6QMF4_9PSEU|nr:hypothetical protein [Actinokineospora globicatena]GLW91330.1 hypothetical protein Aglo03_21460 [Actinokineospora globicatena]
MTRTRPRHLLVLATRCAGAAQPDDLERAAVALHAALTDTELGAMSGSVVSVADPDDARTQLLNAAAVARGAGAELVLAVLGSAGATGYLAENGAEVDLPELIAELTPSIVLLDVHGATHPITVAGVTVLTSVVGRFQASLALSAVIRAGDPAGDEHIALDTALAATIGATVTGESIALVPNRVWAPQVVGDVVGPLGRATLDRLLEAWGGFPVPPTWTRARFDELRAVVESAPDTLTTRRLLHTHSALFYAVHAAECVREHHLGKRLSTEAIRAAATSVGLVGDATGTDLLVRVLEDAALNGSARGKPKAAVARLLVALARAVGADGEHPAVRAWAAEVDAEPEVRDASAEVLDRPSGRKELRLVVSLAADAPWWPDVVEAYLVRPGQSPTPQTVFDSDRTQVGAEAAIGEAVEWATDRLAPGERLRYLDLAAPAHLLATWYPERGKPGRFFLGARHQVLTQWTGWLDPATYSADLHANAAEVVRRVGVAAGVPLDPLDAHALGDLAVLDERLANGEFVQAIALDHRPADLTAVLELLLPYCPILLWPREESDGWLAALRERWGSLPEGLASAYREGSPLQCLRSVWHDEDWLVFGRRLARREMNSPN